MEDVDQPKNELKRLMIRAAWKAQEGIQISQEGLKSDQQILDLANAGLEVLNHPIPENVEWESLIDRWERLNALQDGRLGVLRTTYGPSALNSTASGTAYYMAPFSYPTDPIKYHQNEFDEATKQARIHLMNVIDQSINKDDFVALLQKFGFDKRYGNEKTVVEQFQIGWAAYDMPVTPFSPVNTSLIPMRECIESAIKTLLARRPQQEPGKSWRDKIISIGTQVARKEVVRQDIVTWAEQWDELEPLLSGSKKQAYSREEWLDLLRRSTLWFQSFLQGLDISKLKS